MSLKPWVKANLGMQGFACESPAIGALASWLRWTPVLSTVLIVLGTVLRQPVVLWCFAAIAFLGAAGWHPFDVIFNHGLRHALDLPPLPPNPAPRRFAMVLAGCWAALTGILYAIGQTTAGLVAGVLLSVAAITVATTHFCFGSLLWHLVRRGPTPAA